MRFAYAPGFKSGVPLDFSQEAQRRMLFRDLNFYKAMQGDINRPVILTFKEVEVTNGQLTLKCIPGKNSTIRHFDALEVIRE